MNLKIDYKQFGVLQTNCYLISNENETLIIDPGQNSANWILQNIDNRAICILNTHGHYDHVYSNNEVKNKLNIPLIIHKEDSYLLETDEFSVDLPKSIADVTYDGDQDFCIGKFNFKAIHLPGHSHGTSIFDFGDFIISGDFVMSGTVGRYNLHTSDKEKAYKSLKKYLDIYEKTKDKTNVKIYSGHGEPFTLEESLRTVEKWLTFF
jgi:glyoxylase-like metal-dependent hydrolase (beta-lactamase superfamily II)